MQTPTDLVQRGARAPSLVPGTLLSLPRGHLWCAGHESPGARGHVSGPWVSRCRSPRFCGPLSSSRPGPSAGVFLCTHTRGGQQAEPASGRVHVACACAPARGPSAAARAPLFCGTERASCWRQFVRSGSLSGAATAARVVDPAQYTVVAAHQWPTRLLDRAAAVAAATWWRLLLLLRAAAWRAHDLTMRLATCPRARAHRR